MNNDRKTDSDSREKQTIFQRAYAQEQQAETVARITVWNTDGLRVKVGVKCVHPAGSDKRRRALTEIADHLAGLLTHHCCNSGEGEMFFEVSSYNDVRLVHELWCELARHYPPGPHDRIGGEMYTGHQDIAAPE